MENILRQKRIESGYTLAQMSDKLGIDVGNVSKYELGDRCYKTQSLLKIKKVYQLTDEELLQYIQYVTDIKNK